MKYYFIQESELNLISGFNAQCSWFSSIAFGLVTFVLGTYATCAINPPPTPSAGAMGGWPMVHIICGACLLLAFGSAAMAFIAWRNQTAAIAELKTDFETTEEKQG